MKLLRSVLVSVCLPLLFLPLAAKAQFSVFGTFGASNYGYSYNNDNLTFSPDRADFGLGGFYNFPIQSRFTAGIDARFSDTPSARGGNKGFVSARFGFSPHRNPLEPYLQIGGGYVQSKVPASSYTVGAQTLTTAALDLAFGLDVRLHSSWEWRAIELESGAGVKSSKSAGSASLSTGIVYRFGPGHGNS